MMVTLAGKDLRITITGMLVLDKSREINFPYKLVGQGLKDHHDEQTDEQQNDDLVMLQKEK